MNIAGATSVGLVRSNNEDAFFFTANQIGPLSNLFIVADGMGGHNAGEVASAKSLEYFHEFVLQSHRDVHGVPGDMVTFLVGAVEYANKGVYEHSLTNPGFSGMGTTFSACAVLGDKLAIAHIGDSRIYTIAQGRVITQITEDHSYVAEMVQAGNITPTEAKIHPNRNQLTRVLGCEPPVNVDGILHDINGVDSVLLCSDGLTDMLSDEEIMSIVSQNTFPQTRVQDLIDAANDRGGKDNITVIIIDVKGETN